MQIVCIDLSCFSNFLANVGVLAYEVMIRLTINSVWSTYDVIHDVILWSR